MTQKAIEVTAPVADPQPHQPEWRRTFLVVGAALVAVLLVAATWATLTLLGYQRVPAEGSAAAIFARDMSSHHRQAVEMAELIRPVTRDEEVRRLATDIVLTQQAQIGLMQGWLDVWGLPLVGSPSSPMHEMDGAGEAMPGMATAADLKRLRTMRGVEAEREFLRLMIEHHRGGVAMAQAALRATDQIQVVNLAQAIVDTQTAEIRVMAELLAQLAYVPEGAGKWLSA